MMKYFMLLDNADIGRLMLGEEDGAITDLHFEKSDDLPKEPLFMETPPLLEAARQLSEYFSGRRRKFELPLAPEGTDFQRRCWRALLDIPYGETASYGDVARAIGSPKAVRAVGGANHANPIAIIIPCHRVIGSNGSLTGFGGGLDVKSYLLALEARYGQA